MNAAKPSAPVQAFSLVRTTTRTYTVSTDYDPETRTWLGSYERTETRTIGRFDFLICGDRAFVCGWTGSPDAYGVRYGWRAMSRAEARAEWKRLRGDGYEPAESALRVLGYVDFAGGDVWHSWGEGANRCGKCAAPAQIAPVLAPEQDNDRVMTLFALSAAGDHVREGDVAYRDWYSYEAARALMGGDWTATDPMIAVDSVDDSRGVRLAVL